MRGSLLALLLVAPSLALAEDGVPAAPPVPPAVAPTLPGAPAATVGFGKEYLLEFSFGQSHLFIPPDVAPQGVPVVTLPTSASLLLGELLLSQRFAVATIFNIPNGPQKTVVDGKTIDEKIAMAVAAGVRVSPVGFDLRKDAHLELQLAAFVGQTFGGTAQSITFPMLAGRLHLSRPDGFAMYLGASWTFRKDTLALFYGGGHRF